MSPFGNGESEVRERPFPGKNTQVGFIILMNPRSFMITAPSSVLRKIWNENDTR